MNNLQTRITTSFATQGLMATLGVQIALVQDGEVDIVLPFSKHL